MGVLGELAVRVNANIVPFQRGLAEAKAEAKTFEQRISNLSRSLRRTGGALTAGLTVPLGIAAGALVKAASDAEETGNKFAVTFQGITAEAEATATSLADNFGLASEESRRLLANTGDLLVGFGFTRDSALDLSDRVVQLGADLASFTNLQGGAEDAADRLTRALLGERDSAKALGVVITEELVTAEIAALRATGELTDETDQQAKALATLNIAVRQSQNAIGDFARSQDSFANQSRILRSRLSDLAVLFGNELLPIATNLVWRITELVTRFTEMDSGQRRLIITVGALAAAVGPLLFTIGALAPAVTAVKAAMTALAGPVGIVAAGLGLVAFAVVDVVRAQKRLANEAELVERAVRGQSSSLEELDAAFDLVNDDINQLANATDGFNQAIANEQLPILRAQRDQIIENRGALRDAIAEQEAARDAAAAAERQRITDELAAEQQRIADLQALALQEAELDAQREQRRNTALANLKARIADERALRENALQAAVDAERAAQAERTRITEAETAARLAAEEQTQQAVLGLISDFGELAATLVGKDARKRAQIQKVFGIFDTIISTAIAVGKALASAPPPANFALAAVTAIRGAAQTAIIAARPLPQLQSGGIVPASPGGTQAIVGEGGSSEAVLPLTDEVLAKLGNEIVSALARAPDQRDTQEQLFNVVVEIGGERLFEQITKASRDGRILIDPRRGIASIR